MKLNQLLAIAALAGSGLTAMAAPVLLTADPTMPGTYTGSFTQSVDGLFVDDFSFLPSSFSGTVSVTLSVLSGSVNFFTGSLNGQDFGYDPASGSTFSFQAQVSDTTPLGLTVFGAVLDADQNPGGTGSYFASVVGVSNVSAVPEPASLALAMAGLLGLGLATRRRRGRCPA